jgi:DNA-binding SARP family transcriptional activator
MTTMQAEHAAGEALGDARPDCEIRVLGPLTVVDTPMTRTSHRRLLSLLLLGEYRHVSVDALVGRFWVGTPPRTARAAIHTHVSAIRHALPDGVIVTVGDGYRIDTDRVVVDRDEFGRIVQEAHVHAASRQWRAALLNADAALAVWNGEPFTELAHDAFAVAEITRLRELRLEAIELRAESLLQLGRARESIADLEWATRTFPLRESLSSLLALARQETGAHADALRSLHSTERALAELGLEPSPALRDLEQQILQHRRAFRQSPDRGDAPERRIA